MVKASGLQMEDGADTNVGKKFTDPEEKKKYRNMCSIKDRNNAFIEIKEGEIKGLPISVNKCKNCQIYIQDFHVQLTLDNCENCIVVLGPCSSSAFLRSSKNCIFVVTCQQLRCRDLKDCEIMLYSHTDPVIEASSGLKFRNHQYFYKDMLYHMNQAKISVWNNQWTYIYDFTVKSDEQHFERLYDSDPNFVTERSEISAALKKIESRGKNLGEMSDVDDEDIAGVNLSTVS
jgi:protein XRP2